MYSEKCCLLSENFSSYFCWLPILFRWTKQNLGPIWGLGQNRENVFFSVHHFYYLLTEFPAKMSLRKLVFSASLFFWVFHSWWHCICVSRFTAKRCGALWIYTSVLRRCVFIGMLFTDVSSDICKGRIARNNVSFTNFSCHFLGFNPNKILLCADFPVSVSSQDCHGIYIWKLKRSSESLLRFMNWLCRSVKFFLANMRFLPCERSGDCLFKSFFSLICNWRTE